MSRHFIALLLMGLLLAGCSAGEKSPSPPGTTAAVAPLRTLADQNDLAFMLIKQGKWDKAITAAKVATEMDSRSAPAWFNLGRANLGAQRGAEAVNALRQASQLTEGNNPDTEYFLGKALEATGKSAEALDVYRRARAKWPDDKELLTAYKALANEELVSLQQAARTYQAGPSPDSLRALATALEAYLQSVSSRQMGPHGNEMGVMAVYGEAPAPRIIQLHAQGYVWIQWWAGDQPRVQRLYEGAPYRVEWSVAFVEPSGQRYLAILQTEGNQPITEMVVLYRLDAPAEKWVQVKDAFQPFPTKVGNLAVQSSPDRIAVQGNGLIKVEDQGRTVIVCEPKYQGACTSAHWNGQQYGPK